MGKEKRGITTCNLLQEITTALVKPGVNLCTKITVINDFYVQLCRLNIYPYFIRLAKQIVFRIKICFTEGKIMLVMLPNQCP